MTAGQEMACEVLDDEARGMASVVVLLCSAAAGGGQPCHSLPPGTLGLDRYLVVELNEMNKQLIENRIFMQTAD